MPLYVYKCNDCEHQFEVRQRFSEDPLTDCRQCDGQVRRVINPVGVVFKGSGFYVTDSRNGKSGSLLNGSANNGSDEKSDNKEKKAEGNSTTVTANGKADKPASTGASGSPVA